MYPSTIVGIPPQEDGWLGKATERIFLAPIKMTMVPEIVDMEMPLEGVFHNLTIVKIKKEYSGQALKVMNAMWGAGQMMFNKIMVVVDESVVVTDYKQAQFNIGRLFYSLFPKLMANTMQKELSTIQPTNITIYEVTELHSMIK